MKVPITDIEKVFSVSHRVLFPLFIKKKKTKMNYVTDKGKSKVGKTLQQQELEVCFNTSMVVWITELLLCAPVSVHVKIKNLTASVDLKKITQTTLCKKKSPIIYTIGQTDCIQTA